MRTSEALDSAVALLGDGPMSDLELLDALGYDDDPHEVLTFLRVLRADGRIVLLGDGRAVLREALGEGLTGWHRLTAEEVGARTIELGVELVLVADLAVSIDPVQVGDDAVALRHAEDADGELDLARGPLLVLPDGWEPALAEGDLVGLVARDGALALVRGPVAGDLSADPPAEIVTALVAALDAVADVEGEVLALGPRPDVGAAAEASGDAIDVETADVEAADVAADDDEADDDEADVAHGVWVLHLDRVAGVLLADHGDTVRALDRPLAEVLAATDLRVEDGTVLGPNVSPEAWMLHRVGRDILFDAFPDEWPEPGDSDMAGLAWLALSTEGDPLPATAVAEWLEEPMVAEAIAARLDQVPDHVVGRALGLLDDVRDQAGTETALPPDGLRGVALVTGRALLLEGRLPEAAAVLEDAFADLSFEWPAGVELLGLLRAVAGDVDGAVAAYGELGEDGVVDRLLAWVPTPPVGVGRNAPCPCGSGRKFKQCCLRRPPALGLDARVPFLWWKLQMAAVELLGRHVPDVSEPHATAEVGAVAVDALLLEAEAVLDVARMLDPLLPDDERALLASWGVPSRTVLEVVARDGDALVVRDLVAGGEHRVGAEVLDHGGVGTRILGVVVAGASADGSGHLVGPVVHLTSGAEAVVDACAAGLDAQAVVDLVEELIGSSSNAHIH